MKQTQNLNRKMTKTKNILLKPKKKVKIHYRIQKKRELRKKKYIRRTRPKNNFKSELNRPPSHTSLKISHKSRKSSKEISITSEGFDIFNENGTLGSFEMNSTYDLINFSPLESHSIFGGSNTIFDMSSASRKTTLWGKIFCCEKINFVGKNSPEAVSTKSEFVEDSSYF